jgi:hypothetical protein
VAAFRCSVRAIFSFKFGIAERAAAIPNAKIIAVNMKKRIEKRVFQSEKR